MEKEIKIEAIKDKTEFDRNLIKKINFIYMDGKKKVAWFRVSHAFLAASSLDKINKLMERAVNNLIPKFEINNAYFFDIDTQSIFSQLEEKPDWAND